MSVRNNRKLPENFLFTQHSLSTFENCPLKFKRCYIENINWDTYTDRDTRKQMEMGKDFHLLAMRYFMGIDPGLHEHDEGYYELSLWLENLKGFFKLEPQKLYLPEYKLRMKYNNINLEANFDLLVIWGDRAEIWDWKTQSKKKSNAVSARSKKLADSLQSMVYLFALREKIELVLGRKQASGGITMSYWQPDPPGIIERIEYDDCLHEEFRELLRNKIKNVLEYDYSDFDGPPPHGEHCRICEFRWLCDNQRGG